jgi:hypothetical protein
MGFRIGAGGARQKRFAVVYFLALQSFYFSQRRLQPASTLSRSTPPGAGLTRRQLFLARGLRV